MNTKQSGELHFFVFKRPNDTEYTGVCFELGIVKEGEKEEVVKHDLEEAAKGYVFAVCKNNMSDELLNQRPAEFVPILQEYMESIQHSVTPVTKHAVSKPPVFDSASIYSERVGNLCPAN